MVNIKHILSIFLVCSFTLGSGQSLDLSDPENDTPDSGILDRMHYKAVNLLPNYGADETDESQGYGYEGNQDAKLNVTINPKMSGNTMYSDLPIGEVPLPSIDTELSVGAISYSTNISPTGAFNINVPIHVPKGTNGMEPSLSLSYNSQGQLNGVAGAGWSINGSSVIYRSSKSLYFDHSTNGLNFGGSDAIKLDGTRLVVDWANQNWAVGNTYYPEDGSNIKVTSHGELSFGSSEWYEARTKDGLIHEYGKTENSRVEGPDGKVYSWHLSKTTDLYGNYVSYTYKKVNNQIVLEEVSYTGGGSFEPYNRIVFGYDERQDQQRMYINGMEVYNTLILREVKSYSKENVVRTLKLNYQIDSSENHPFAKRSFLHSVEEYGYGLTQINSLFFKYGHQSDLVETCHDSSSNCFQINQTVFQHIPFGQPQPSSHYRTGDFNGDGYTDIIGFEYYLQSYAPPYYTFGYSVIHLYLNDRNGGYEYSSTSDPLPANFELDPAINYGIIDLSEGTFFPLFISNAPDYRLNSQIMDLNGDGKQDLVIRHSTGGSTYYTPWMSTGTGFVKMENNANVLQNSQEWSMTYCDLNGDGVTEMLSVNHSFPDQQFVKLHIFDIGDGQSYNQTVSHYPSGPSDRINPRIIAMDIDGDGADEILTWKGSSTELRIMNFIFGNQYCDENGVLNVGTINFDFLSTATNIAYDMHIFPGDLNGDGRTDLVVGNPNNGNWYVYLNKHNRDISNLGASFVEIDAPVNLAPFDDESPGEKWVLADLNGDGNTEIVYIFEHFVESFILQGEIWEKRKFEYLPNKLLPGYLSIGGYDDVEPYTFFNFGDFNGDGVLEIFVQDWLHTNNVKIYQLYDSPSQNLISSMRNSFGEVLNINYTPLSSDLVYSESEIAEELVLPYKKQTSALMVVESVESENNIGEINKVSYKYENALHHTFGKGLLGFSMVQNYNHTIEKFHEKSQTVNANLGVITPTSTKSYRLIEIEDEIIEDLIGEKSYTFNYVELQTRIAPYGTQTLRYRIDNTGKSSKSYITGEESNTTRSYDSHGNLMSVIEASILDQNETTTTYGAYELITNWWTPSLPPSKTVSSVRPGEVPVVQEEEFDYYFVTGAIKSVTSRPNTNSWSKKEFVYNSKGLKELVTVSGMGVETVTEEFVHTSDGRNVLEFTNGLGLITTYSHSDLWGTVKTKTDQFGREKSIEYDSFGMIKKETDFLGRWQSFEHEWSDDVNGEYTDCDDLGDVLFKKIENSDNNRTRVTFFNKFRKPRYIEETAQFGVLKKTICYDELGRVLQEDIPYFEDDLNVNKRTTLYDNHNRILQQGIYSRIADFSYELVDNEYEIKVESNAEGTKSSFLDQSGLKIKSTDPGGTLEYEYFSGGLQKNVKYGNDTIIEHTYDDFGRKTSIHDVNAGTFGYDYDSYDRLIIESDDRNNETTTFFNSYGQIDFKMVDTPESNGIYDYEYYPSGSEVHKLKKETAPSGNSKEYIYDENDNIKTTILNIDGTDYSSNFDYDSKGKLIRTEYPSEFAVRFVYDDKDFLQKITTDNGELVIWEVGNDGVNSQGQLTKFHLGNGLTVNQVFDENNFPDLVTVANDSETIFTFDYSFDGITGNLLQRNLGSSNEHFGYDEDGLFLNRLSGIGSNPSEIEEEFEYMLNGNILHKDDMGPYIYHNVKKNAVSQVGIPVVGGNQVYLQTISYNHFNSASEINNMDDDLKLVLEYGPDNQRCMAEYFDTSNENDEWIKTRIYAGHFEKQINTDLSSIKIHYISAAGQLVAIYVEDDSQINDEGLNGKMYYPHLDHLGSIINITDVNGDVVFTQSFDAWGRTRNSSDHAYDNIPDRPDWLWRGYTGHEHLDEFGLINMNGRMYDPVVGRMLSPDNYVQSPDFSQSYNRYSYVWNNPLKYTDPSGEILRDIFNTISDVLNVVVFPAKLMTEGVAFINSVANRNPQIRIPNAGYLFGDQLPYSYMASNGLPPSQTVAIDGSRIMGGQVGSAGFTDASGQHYSSAEYERMLRQWEQQIKNAANQSVPAQKQEIEERIEPYAGGGPLIASLDGFDYGTDPEKSRDTYETRNMTPEEIANWQFRGGSPSLIGGIGGVGVLLGITRIPKAWLGLKVGFDGSRTTLASSAMFYKLGIRGSLGRKMWTPYGNAHYLETFLGRWTAPVGAGTVLYDSWNNGND